MAKIRTFTRKHDSIGRPCFCGTEGNDTACTQDHEDPAEVNEKLDSMGYGIGQRLIDELLAKSNVGQVRVFVCACARGYMSGLHAGGVFAQTFTQTFARHIYSLYICAEGTCTAMSYAHAHTKRVSPLNSIA